MSNPGEFHEINEDELEQISGGRSDGTSIHFRCPVCGREEWLGFAGAKPPACMYCMVTTGKNVAMEPV